MIWRPHRQAPERQERRKPLQRARDGVLSLSQLRDNHDRIIAEHDSLYTNMILVYTIVQHDSACTTRAADGQQPAADDQPAAACNTAATRGENAQSLPANA